MFQRIFANTFLDGGLNTKHWLINRCDYPAAEHAPLQKNNKMTTTTQENKQLQRGSGIVHLKLLKREKRKESQLEFSK